MIDSGGFVLSTKPTPSWTVDKVAESFREVEADVYVTLDYPPGPTDRSKRRMRKIISSTENFRRLRMLLPTKVIMPVIHGRTIAEIEFAIALLRKHARDLSWVGLGGIVPLLMQRSVSAEIAAAGPEVFIAAALRRIRFAFPKARIHAFGAGGTRTFPALHALGADSADSIGWRQAAGFGSIFLPLKSQRVVKWSDMRRPPRKTLDRSDLAQLDACECPICIELPSVAQKLRVLKAHFHGRSIHNAWTIVRQTNFWPEGRRELVTLMESGALGSGWAAAARSVG